MGIWKFSLLLVLINGTNGKPIFWNTMLDCLPGIVKNTNSQIIFLEEELREYNVTKEFLRMSLDRSVVDAAHASQVVGTFVMFPESNLVDYKKLLDGQVKPGSKYLLLLGGIGKLFYLFDTWVRRQLLDVAALAPNRYGGVNLYTFDPFKPGRCWDAEPQRVDVCKPGGTFVIGADPFSKRYKTSDLHGCPVRIAAMVKKPELYFEDGTPTGLLSHLYRELARALCYKPKTFVVSHEVSGSSVSEIVTNVAEGAYDFGFGRFSHLVDGVEGIAFSRQTGVDCFTWGVPRHAGTKPSDLAPFFFEFHFEMWSYILLAAVSAPLAFKILTYLSPVEEKVFRSGGFLIFFTYATVMGTSVKAVPRSDSLRLLVSHWLLYCLVVLSAYQASMGSLITVPSEVNDIDSTDALLGSDLRLKGGAKMFVVLNESAGTSDVIQRSLDRFEIILPEEFQQTVFRAYTERKMAVFSTSRDLAYAYIITKRSAQQSMHILKECLVKSSTSPAIFKKGAPLEDSINRAVSSFLESGILNFWEKHIKNLPTNRNSTGMAVNTQLTLKQMKAPLLFLTIGHSLACLVLLFELFVKNIWNKKKSKNIVAPKLLILNRSGFLP